MPFLNRMSRQVRIRMRRRCLYRRVPERPESLEKCMLP